MGRLPVAEDFPSNVTVTIVPPPNNDPPTSILILLHGFGDTNAPFTNLAKQLNLPETAGLSVQALQGLLDLGGSHWGDDIIFDTTNGGLDADAGFTQATAMLKGLVEDSVVSKCKVKARDVVLFGFGQGGMAALNLAVAMQQAASSPGDAELGGVISVGAGLPAEAPTALVNKCKTPVLVCAGTAESAVTATSEDKLRRAFEHVEIKRYRRPGDGMPSNRDEMMPIMQFFSRRLRSSKGVPAGSVEIGN